MRPDESPDAPTVPSTRSPGADLQGDGFKGDGGQRKTPRWPRMRVIAATVGGVLLVSLVGAVFALQASHRAPALVASATATTATPYIWPTKTATIPANLGVPGAWTPVAGLSHTSGQMTVAPCDPHVVYLAGILADVGNAATPTKYAPKRIVLRRTDDTGATWHDLPLPWPHPDPAATSALFISVNPHLATTVYLGVNLDLHTPGDCPFILTQIGECYAQYVTLDGGQHWQPLAIPEVDQLGKVVRGDGATVTSTPSPQAAVDYQLVRRFCICSGTLPPARLARSTDGGVTWRFADADLFGAGFGIDDLTAVPGSQTLYAITRAFASTQGAPGDPWILGLWRSDDAGVHWAAVSNAPFPAFGGVVATRRTSDGAPLLYAYMTDTLDQSGATPDYVQASVDGGKTWAKAPAVPGFARFDYGSKGLLAHPDGSVMVTSSPTRDNATKQLTLYSWSVGASAWRPITPTLVSFSARQLIANHDAATGRTTIWTLADTPDGDAAQTFTIAS